MSDLQARVTNSPRAFHVEGYEKIEYDLVYVDGVFGPDSLELAETYGPYGRALMVVDETVSTCTAATFTPTSSGTVSSSR